MEILFLIANVFNCIYFLLLTFGLRVSQLATLTSQNRHCAWPLWWCLPSSISSSSSSADVACVGSFRLTVQAHLPEQAETEASPPGWWWLRQPSKAALQ